MKLPAMHSKSRFVLWLVCLCIIILPGCSHAQDLKIRDLAGNRGGNLVLAISAKPTTFNRMMASGLPTLSVSERISADLIHINRNTLQLEPALATHWEADKSGRIYTIHLRRGVRFSDGTPFTADDVLFTFQVLADKKTGTAMAGQMEIDGVLPSCTKIDAYTLKIAFPRPVGMGLRMLDSIPMLPKTKLLKAYKEGRLGTAWDMRANPADVVGLGPFRLKEFDPETRIVLERNPYYWKTDNTGTRLPYLDSITFLIIPDFNSEALRFQQGELDLISSPSLNPGSYASLRRNQTKFGMRNLGAGLSMDYLWFNLNPQSRQKGKAVPDPEKLALFQKPEFRRAISSALDRKGMARSVFQSLGSPQYGIVSSGNTAWYNPQIVKTEYNPEHARELLSRLGLGDNDKDGTLEYGHNRRPLEINLLTARGNTAREKMAQIIQSNLSQIGIRISIQLLLPNEIASRFLDSFNYEAILFGFAPTDVAPDLQLNLWYSSGSFHFWHPNQPKPSLPWEAEADALISKLVTTRDAAIRKSSFGRAQQIWSEQLPAISTVAPDILAGWSSRLGNVRPSIVPPHLVWNAEEITKRTN